MKRIKLFPLFLILFTMQLSCSKNDGSLPCNYIPNSVINYDPISDSERTIMEDCSNNRYTSKTDVENNLIGEWELIGYGDGFPLGSYNRCGYVVIEENSLVISIKNQFTEEISSHQWEILESNTSNGVINFRLSVTPSVGNELAIYVFCEKYMFGDATPVDGNMFLYRKVK